MPLVWPVSNVPTLLTITVYVHIVCAIVMEKRPAQSGSAAENALQETLSKPISRDIIAWRFVDDIGCKSGAQEKKKICWMLC